MPILHLGPLQLEGCRRPFAGVVIPSVGEQDTADVQKHAGDCSRFLHRLSSVDRITAGIGLLCLSVGSQRRLGAK